MRSILEQALEALINEDQATADKLFHDYILERSRRIHESIRQGEDFVLEDIMDDDLAEGKSFKRNKDDDADEKKSQDRDRKEAAKTKRKVSESHGSIEAVVEYDDQYLACESLEIANEVAIAIEANEEGAAVRALPIDQIPPAAYEKAMNGVLINSSTLSRLRGGVDDPAYLGMTVVDEFFNSGFGESVVEDSNGDEFEYWVVLVRGDDVSGDLYDLDDAISEARAAIKNLHIQWPNEGDLSDLVEVRDNIGRLWWSQATGQVDPDSSVTEGKSFKRGEDDEEDVKQKRKDDKQKRDSRKQPVDEGKLEVTQGDDGTLNITHTPEASVDDGLGMAPPAPMPELPPLETTELPQLDDMSADADMDLEVDLSDDEFDQLGESLASELEKILVNTKDGDFATSGSAKQEKHSPVPNVPAKDRMSKGGAATIKGDEHNGFDREPTPAVAGKKSGDNTMKHAKDAQSPAKTAGGALLNQFGDDKSAKSPIGGK